jgi:hypothetical protein
MALIVLIAGLAAGAQTTSTTPVELAPQKKTQVVTPPPAKQTPAQARAAARAARLQQKQQTAATAVTPATSSVPIPRATASGNSVLPSSSSSVQSPAAPGKSGAVGTGTLAWATRVYSPTGCVHNGNKAVCTFSFVNQGNAANLLAGNGGELAGIQLVDDAHVPHRWDSAYFMDKYGAQQRRLVVQPGDTGTYVVGFSNVNPGVSSADFHLRDQMIGGIPVGGPESKPGGAPVSNTK